MSDLEGVEPTTGAPYDDYADVLPPGCGCHIREDVDYGDVRVPPPGGCTVHPVNGPLEDYTDCGWTTVDGTALTPAYEAELAAEAEAGYDPARLTPRPLSVSEVPGDPRPETRTGQ